MLFLIFVGIGISIAIIGLIFGKIPPDIAREIILGMIALGGASGGLALIVKYLYQKR